MVKGESNVFSNKTEITEMLEILDEEISKKTSVETYFGKQDPSNGYQLKSITCLENSALAEVFMKDRAIRVKDNIKDGDLVVFHITEENHRYVVRTDEEYQTMTRINEEKMDVILNNGTLTEINSRDHQTYFKVKDYDEEQNVVVCAVFEIYKLRNYHKHMIKGNCEYPLEHFLEISRLLTDKEKKLLRLIEIKAGDCFNYQGIEYTCLEVFSKEVYGRKAVLAVTSKTIESMKFAKKHEDGCNNWRKSKIRTWLNGEFFDSHISKEDILPQISDLTADNGDNIYGTSEDFVTMLSCDQFRKYRKIMPKYDTWVWTVTPHSCYKGNAWGVRVICSTGELYNDLAEMSYGVAAACLFDFHNLMLHLQ